MNGIRIGRHRGKRRVTCSPLLTVVLIFALSAAATGLSLLMQPGSIFAVAKTFLQQPLLILLNWFPPLVLTAIAYFLIGNVFYAGAVSSAVIPLMSYVNLLKIEGREDTFVPADITLIREALGAVRDYQLPMHYGKLALIVLFVGALIALGVLVGSPRPKWPIRLIAAAAAAAVFVCSVRVVYTNKRLYEHFRVPSAYNIASVFNTLGFNYCFLYNFDLYPITKPDGFSRAEVAAWDKTAPAAEPEVKPNVLMVMCEAFSDLSDEPVFAYEGEDDPLYYYHLLADSDRALSGRIIVSNYGAGTANTEFDVMTGIQTEMISGSPTSAFRVVRRDMRNISTVFRGSGYDCFFMHPGQSWFYNRTSVYAHFGITEQTFSDAFDASDYKGRMISDAAFLDELKAEMEEKLAGAPLFGYTVTIENHQNYNYSKYDDPVPAVPLNVEVSAGAAERLSVYLEGVRDSSVMLYELTAWLDTLEEPTVLVFFGDHRPNVGTACSEIGLRYNENLTTEETVETYAVPFMIWGNAAYADAVDLPGAYAALELPENGCISSNYLGAMTLELCGLDAQDAFYSELNALRRELPVFRCGESAYVLGDGSFTDTPGDALSARLERLRRWNYYLLKY